MKQKMKRVLYCGSILVLLGITIIGCKKEKQITTAITQESDPETSSRLLYTSNNSLLIFNTSLDYENAITNISDERTFINNLNSLGYTSYTEELINQGTTAIDLIKDNILSAVLNKDRVVQIGQYLYKVNMQLDKIFVLPTANISEYLDLINENKLNKNIKEYSATDDVIHLSEGNKISSCGGIGGGVYPCYSNVYSGQIIKTFSNGVVWRLNPFVRFFKAGIYFKLSSQYEIWRFPTASSTSGGQIVNNISGESITIEMFVKGPEGWWKRRPCNSGTIGTLSSGFHFSESIYGNYTKTVYSGTRNLNGYFFFVQGRAKYSNGSVTIASPYGGRNINSPY